MGGSDWNTCLSTGALALLEEVAYDVASRTKGQLPVDVTAADAHVYDRDGMIGDDAEAVIAEIASRATEDTSIGRLVARAVKVSDDGLTLLVNDEVSTMLPLVRLLGGERAFATRFLRAWDTGVVPPAEAAREQLLLMQAVQLQREHPLIVLMGTPGEDGLPDVWAFAKDGMGAWPDETDDHAAEGISPHGGSPTSWLEAMTSPGFDEAVGLLSESLGEDLDPVVAVLREMPDEYLDLYNAYVRRTRGIGW